MTSSNSRRLAIGTGLIAALGAVGAAWAQPERPARYTVTDLGPSNGQAFAFHVAGDGAVAGMLTAALTPDFHGGLWNNGAVTEIGPLAGETQSVAYDIDATGRVIGTSFALGTPGGHAFAYRGGTLSGLGDFQARAVSAGGMVVGSMSLTVTGFGLVDHACSLQPGSGVPMDLGTLGGSSSFAYAIDDLPTPTIVGSSLTPNDNTTRATLWRDGVVRDLGTLGGLNSVAYGISNQGHVVGVAEDASRMPRAFFYTLSAMGGVATRADLGAFPGGQSAANGINEFDQVVGTSDSRAFAWWDGRMRDLNAMIPSGTGWRLEAAHSINDSGLIVGRGYHVGVPHAFLLTPASTCAADVNLDGILNSQDFFDYLSDFFAGASSADFNADTLLNSADFFDFLTAFFTGC